MFSGIECFREAMVIIQSAIAERFGVVLNHDYELMVLWWHNWFQFTFWLQPFNQLCAQWCLSLQHEVEKNRICRKLLGNHFPDTCLASDIFELLKSKPKAKRWAPRKLQLAKWFWCENHCKEYLDEVSSRLFNRQFLPMGNSLRLTNI